MSTIFQSIRLLHLAQLATRTKVKGREPFLYDGGEYCKRTRVQVGDRRKRPQSYHFNMVASLFKCKTCALM